MTEQIVVSPDLLREVVDFHAIGGVLEKGRLSYAVCWCSAIDDCMTVPQELPRYKFLMELVAWAASKDVKIWVIPGTLGNFISSKDRRQKPASLECRWVYEGEILNEILVICENLKISEEARSAKTDNCETPED